MPEPNRTTKRRAETRRRLVSVAYEVFAEHGIGDAPVELICERAGFTRGAFYSNFTSKEALFLAVYEEQMQVRLDRLRAAVDEVIADPASRHPESLRETLGRIGERFMAPLMSDKTWYLVCAEFRVQALRQPPLRAQTEAAQEKFRQATAEVLTRVVAATRHDVDGERPGRGAGHDRHLRNRARKSHFRGNGLSFGQPVRHRGAAHPNDGPDYPAIAASCRHSGSGIRPEPAVNTCRQTWSAPASRCSATRFSIASNGSRPV
ncbi:TetR/AcrR family transcriptional regulator [Fodinicola feengrottensis]|uniref:TetR/AcrR family transcriptional regulator n=1 Tax=Fodinicola feengrottensis TaxID=435914 RepID=UPI002442EC19|nr:TetR/AcrR family transcriptional regulator [Fodinicola feengrottensis]